MVVLQWIGIGLMVIWVAGFIVVSVDYFVHSGSPIDKPTLDYEDDIKDTTQN